MIVYVTGVAAMPDPARRSETWQVPPRVPLLLDCDPERGVGYASLTRARDGMVLAAARIEYTYDAFVDELRARPVLCVSVRPAPGQHNGPEPERFAGAHVVAVGAVVAHRDYPVPNYDLSIVSDGQDADAADDRQREVLRRAALIPGRRWPSSRQLRTYREQTAQARWVQEVRGRLAVALGAAGAGAPVRWGTWDRWPVADHKAMLAAAKAEYGHLGWSRGGRWAGGRVQPVSSGVAAAADAPGQWAPAADGVDEVSGPAWARAMFATGGVPHARANRYQSTLPFPGPRLGEPQPVAEDGLLRRFVQGLEQLARDVDPGAWPRMVYCAPDAHDLVEGAVRDAGLQGAYNVMPSCLLDPGHALVTDWPSRRHEAARPGERPLDCTRWGF